MIASLIPIVGALSMMYCAKRVKFNPIPRTVIGPVVPQGPMIHTPINGPQLQMNVPASTPFDFAFRVGSVWKTHVPASNPFDFAYRFGSIWKTNSSGPKLQMNASKPLAYRFGSVWKAKSSDTQNSTEDLSYQRFPPTFYGMDARQLLHKWIDSLVNPFEERVPEVEMITIPSLATNDGFPPPHKMTDETPKHWQDDKAMILRKMQDVIADMTHNWIHLKSPLSAGKKVEMVGLISKWSWSKLLAADSPVLALGLFSREKFKDDRIGSLRNKIGQLYGKPWTHRQWGKAEEQLDVFAIEGLAALPGPERSARALLSEIDKYAHKEQKIVVVPKRACTGSDGTDLTEYYVRLGFDKVKMKGWDEAEDWHELVYIGTSSAEDLKVENQQMMVGMNLGLDIGGRSLEETQVQQGTDLSLQYHVQGGLP